MNFFKKMVLIFFTLGMILQVGCQENTEVLGNFKYDPAKMDVGNLYHYKVSPIKGEDSFDYYLYIESKDTIRAYQDFSNVVPLVQVIKGTFDIEHMMFKTLHAENPFSDERIPNTNNEAYGEWNFAEKKMFLRWSQFDRKGNLKNNSTIINVNQLPAFDITLYHTDLQIALRFLENKNEEFPIGNYRGDSYIGMGVKYDGEETVNGILCEKYAVDGKGISAIISKLHITIWLAKDDERHYMVKYENKMKIYPFKNIKLELVDIKKLNGESGWNDFVESKNVEARGRLDIFK